MLSPLVGSALLSMGLLLPSPLPRVSSRALEPQCMLAEDDFMMDDDDDANSWLGVSLVESRAQALSVDSLPDVAGVLSDWQEQMAIADDGSSLPSAREQEEMMAAWRNLISSKEAALRRKSRHAIQQDGASWTPAYLTGWMGADGASSEDSASRESEDDALLEAHEEKADEVDEDFVTAWQLHAERMREESDRTAARAKLVTRVSGAPVEAARRSLSWFLGGRAGSPGAGGNAAVGIDLGTTNCAVAAVSNGLPYIIPTADGHNIFPSVVSFVAAAADAADATPQHPPLLSPDARGVEVLVGEAAQRQWVTNPHSTYASTKRLIGRTASASELRALAALDVRRCASHPPTCFTPNHLLHTHPPASHPPACFTPTHLSLRTYLANRR